MSRLVEIFDPAQDPQCRPAYLKALEGHGIHEAEEPPEEPEEPENEIDVALALLDDRRVRFSDPPPKPVPIYTLAGQCISTSGNLTVLSGQSKAGKSAVVAAMVAAPFAVPGSDLLGFEAARADGKAVIVFDTEQSPYDAWRLQSRIIARAGLTAQPGNLRHFYLLDLSPQQRVEALVAECERAAEECDGIHCIHVDGLADLIDDPNDSATAFGIITSLIALAVRYSCPLIVVLHENPAPSGQPAKTRGHLGSQAERKAESNISIVKDSSGISTVFSERCRSAHIPKDQGHCFHWDEELQRHISCESAAESKAEADTDEMREQVKAVFAHPSAAGGIQWKPALKIIRETPSCEVSSDSGAQKLLRKWAKAHLVRKSNLGLYVASNR